MKGRLIVFEGADGTGKATQARLLAQRCTAEGVRFHEIDFPRYGNPFAEPSRLYLAGVLGAKPGDVSAYAASIMYAIDRYASYKEDWGRFYEAGGLILANRYTTSNAVHQAVKLPEGEREEYLKWLFDLEYTRLCLPEPDLVVYLELPAQLSEEMLRRREAETQTKADIHEQDMTYLQRCRESAREIARSLGWRTVQCASGLQLHSPEMIHRQVWELVQPVIAGSKD